MQVSEVATAGGGPDAALGVLCQGGDVVVGEALFAADPGEMAILEDGHAGVRAGPDAALAVLQEAVGIGGGEEELAGVGEGALG